MWKCEIKHIYWSLPLVPSIELLKPRNFLHDKSTRSILCSNVATLGRFLDRDWSPERSDMIQKLGISSSSHSHSPERGEGLEMESTDYAYVMKPPLNPNSKGFRASRLNMGRCWESHMPREGMEPSHPFTPLPPEYSLLSLTMSFHKVNVSASLLCELV